MTKLFTILISVRHSFNYCASLIQVQSLKLALTSIFVADGILLCCQPPAQDCSNSPKTRLGFGSK